MILIIGEISNPDVNIVYIKTPFPGFWLNQCKRLHFSHLNIHIID